ncbi:histidine phosphatase family protein [Spirosoma endbachense]|uniref:Histidine phosphatase family protein n=1 Tax=Spirosoma endbachense TaxID=2666025 RepID=A0A6P1W2J8_9BACT|nr:histidine phosphatase family protein [Spirosoma endbachense]QHV98229.1 hypothetical protein GJR95_25930 [Spirosoma endbachense]
MDFYLIRHAESQGNLNHHLIGGRSNHYPLSKAGEQQAIALANRLKREGIDFDCWYSSPAERTKQTAICLRDTVAPMTPIIWEDRLQELSQGDWEGQLRKTIYTVDQLAAINSNNWHHKAPGGESQFEVEERMYTFLESLFGLESTAKIAVVTHGIAIKCLLRRLLNSSPSMTHKINLANTSLTVVKYQNGEWFIERVNDYAHLMEGKNGPLSNG